MTEHEWQELELWSSKQKLESISLPEAIKTTIDEVLLFRGFKRGDLQFRPNPWIKQPDFTEKNDAYEFVVTKDGLMHSIFIENGIMYHQSSVEYKKILNLKLDFIEKAFARFKEEGK